MKPGPLGQDALSALPLGLRTDLMLLPADATSEQDSDCLVVRTPSNPTFWWGNFLHFNAPPAPGDRARWEGAFERHIRAKQAASRHFAFSWSGSEPGDLKSFLAAGYAALQSIVLATEAPRNARPVAPHATIRCFRDEDWDSLLALLIAEREPQHTVAGYRQYAKGRIAAWRHRSRVGLGTWYGAFQGTELASTLGLFISDDADASGRRLARFQEVITATAFRRQGLAGSLIVAAAADLLHRHGAVRFVIVADQNDSAQRLYRRLGFEVVEHHRGLEFGGP